jgi:hypothetical protein
LLDLNQLHRLLAWLDAQRPDRPAEWEAWRVEPVVGGANALLYRAAGPGGELAVKWTRRDGRDRARREYGALLALQQSGLALAPAPVLLECERYAHDVVVQSWLAGEALSAPPESDDDWGRLVEHYVALRQVTPASVRVELAEAFWNAADAASGRRLVEEQLARLPAEAHPPELHRLVSRLEELRLPSWPAPPRAICRVDANYRNFLRRPGSWASVDWENSGWGDPAFEMADLIGHAAYMDVPAARWEWVAERYAELSGDRSARARIPAYTAVALTWWVARLARYRYEVPRGLDPRLAARSDGWEADIAGKERRYIELAGAALARLERFRPCG